MTVLASIRYDCSVRLYSWLVARGGEVELSVDEAAAQAGIKTRCSLIRAREELEALGVIRLEKRDRKFYATLIDVKKKEEEAPEEVLQPFAPRERTFEERADGIDEMPDDGGRKKGSNHMRKLEIQYKFLREVYGQKFPGADVSNASIRKWLDADPSCFYILAAMEDTAMRIATKNDVSSPAAYIARMAEVNRGKRERAGSVQNRAPAAPVLRAATISRPEPSVAEREQRDAENYKKYMEGHARRQAELNAHPVTPVWPRWRLNPADFKPGGAQV